MASARIVSIFIKVCAHFRLRKYSSKKKVKQGEIGICHFVSPDQCGTYHLVSLGQHGMLWDIGILKRYFLFTFFNKNEKRKIFTLVVCCYLLFE